MLPGFTLDIQRYRLRIVFHKGKLDVAQEQRHGRKAQCEMDSFPACRSVPGGGLASQGAQTPMVGSGERVEGAPCVTQSPVPPRKSPVQLGEGQASLSRKGSLT